ncbi:Rieske (2Fe-2S) protein [Cellulosimicrobium cellulans]|uniref:Rieske (2Fe-2S) protein n=1 Tax=Cellulosimicrobium cellulans TaxID=1710 RepID=UPI001EDA4039|nr:Rieske (2Fe-2S) protein [Cellulosimicrobium cellulans]UKJ64558.1 Rieske (2Fe-2S) protein [Cellulosimicrobium cellulans]
MDAPHPAVPPGVTVDTRDALRDAGRPPRPGPILRVPRGATPTRRVVLTGSGAGAALALLAACGGGGPTGTQSDGASRGEGSEGGGPDVGPGQALASVDDVPVGGALAVTVDGAPLLVTQPEEGTFAAFSAICTHQGCTVAPGDGELLCPCHASRYDLATGAVLGGPAPSPLPEVPVTVDDGEVTST